jgi:hypothetical protein
MGTVPAPMLISLVSSRSPVTLHRYRLLYCHQPPLPLLPGSPARQPSAVPSMQSGSTHNLHAVPFSMTRLMYPIPSTQTTTFRTFRHSLRDTVFRQPRPYARMIHRDDCQIVRLESIHIRRIGDSDGCSAKVLRVGGFTVYVVDVKRADSLGLV